MRLYVNFADGMLDQAADSSSTVLESTMFQSLPVVASPDTLSLTLDPRGEDGAPEVVTVTAHTASSAQVTVLRAQEGTAARSHAPGTRVVLALVASDIEVLRDGLGVAESDILALEGDVSVLQGDVVSLSNRVTPLEAAPPAHTHGASDVTSGTLSDARIPNLNASKITAGTFNAARIPNLDASKITTGTLNASRIPTVLGNRTFTTVSLPSDVIIYGAGSGGSRQIRFEVAGSNRMVLGLDAVTVPSTLNLSSTASLYATTSGGGRAHIAAGGGSVTVTGSTFSSGVEQGGSLDLGSTTFRWGRLYTTAAPDYPSDERLKENIEPLGSHDYEWTNVLEGINPIEYDKDGEHTFGFSAQNVQEFLPEVIREDEEGFLSMSTAPMVAVLWQVVKELQARIEVLEAP